MDSNNKKRIGFVSTRMVGRGGVSLESKKWIDVLGSMGHTCFSFSGGVTFLEDDRSYIAEEADIHHPDIEYIQKEIFGTTVRSNELTEKIRTVVDVLKKHLYDYVELYKLDILVAQNTLAIPMNIPLGVAISEVISETGMSVIAHHHDFYWERERYSTHAAEDYLSFAFPPALPSVQHVVINSIAKRKLVERTGQSCVIIPNVMNFDNPPAEIDDYGKGFKQEIGLGNDEVMILQPTRIVRRKNIELAIDFVKKLDINATLVVTHASAKDEDEKYEYELRSYADKSGLKVLFVSGVVWTERGQNAEGKNVYTLDDAYKNADFITYPSEREGFGNALLEAVYCKKPMVVNKYPVYMTDIKPKGFSFVELDSVINEKALEQTREIIKNPEIGQKMAEHNYKLGQKYFSYAVLEKKLQRILGNISDK